MYAPTFVNNRTPNTTANVGNRDSITITPGICEVTFRDPLGDAFFRPCKINVSTTATHVFTTNITFKPKKNKIT